MISESNLLLAWDMEEPIAVHTEQPGEVWAVGAIDEKGR